MVILFGIRYILIFLFIIVINRKLYNCHVLEEDIEVIDLSFNDLEIIEPAQFSNRPNLTTIYLHSNKIQQIPDDLFKNNRKLKIVELQKNLLRHLPKNIFQNARNLLDLKLQENLLNDPWPALDNLTRLEYLNLDDNPIRKINCTILKKLISLQSFHVEFIRDIEQECFHENIHLVDIYIKNKYLKELNKNLFETNKNLENIVLLGDRLEIIPDGLLWHLTKLQSLQLECKLANPWPVFVECKSLVMLVLDKTPLNQITSEHIQTLPNLEFLMARLCNLQLIRFNETHHKLEELNLSYNNLTDLSSNVFSGLINLKKLFLSFNWQIRKLSKNQFSHLENLENLYLNNLSLTNLEKENFSGLKKLIFLDLSENLLTELNADVFSNLPPTLRYIYLNGNQITRLSDGLFFPFKRFILLLYDNLLKNFNHRAFTSDTIIPFLDLDRNPLKCTCKMYSSVLWAKGHVSKSRGFCYPRTEKEHEMLWSEAVANRTDCQVNT